MTSTITLFIFSRWTRGYIKIIYDKCMEGDKIECFHPRPFAFKSSPLSLSTKKKKEETVYHRQHPASLWSSALYISTSGKQWKNIHAFPDRISRHHLFITIFSGIPNISFFIIHFSFLTEEEKKERKEKKTITTPPAQNKSMLQEKKKKRVAVLVWKEE